MADIKEPLIPKIGVVTDIRIDTPDVKTFRVVTPDGKKAFEHMPGQCAMLSIPGVGEAMYDTRMAINASTEAITSQASRIYEQRLQETIFDLKMENQNLKNGIFTKEQTDALAAKISDCCCGFNRRLDAIEGRMLTKPALYGVASTCAGQIIPASCGCNGNVNL